MEAYLEVVIIQGEMVVIWRLVTVEMINGMLLDTITNLKSSDLNLLPPPQKFIVENYGKIPF